MKIVKKIRSKTQIMNNMIKKYPLFAAAFVLAWPACTPDKPTDKYVLIADAYCGCTAKLAEMNRMVAVQASDSSAVLNLQAIESEFLNAQSCASTLIGRYGKLNTAEQKTVLNYVATRCPDLGTQPELLRELLGQ